MGTPPPNPIDPLRTTFVVNPCSAGGRTGRLWPQRERLMRGVFPDAEVQFTHGPGDASRIARQAVERGQTAVVAVGGDGSINEVVDGLLEHGQVHPSPAVLGILPSGSGCDLARYLEIPAEFEGALALLQEGRLRTIDAGLVWATMEQGEMAPRCFVNVASLGITASIAVKVNRSRKPFGSKPTFLWTTVMTLMQWSNPLVRLRVDDEEEREHRIKAVVVANSRYFAGGMGIAPAAQLDDGLFELVILGDLGRFEAVRRLGETYAAKPIDHPDVHYLRCRRLEAEAAGKREVYVEMDGELWGRLPAHFEVLPGALRVVAPPV